MRWGQKLREVMGYDVGPKTRRVKMCRVEIGDMRV